MDIEPLQWSPSIEFCSKSVLPSVFVSKQLRVPEFTQGCTQAQLFGKWLWSTELTLRKEHVNNTVLTSCLMQFPSLCNCHGSLWLLILLSPEDGSWKLSSPVRLSQFCKVKIWSASSTGEQRRPPGFKTKKGCLKKIAAARTLH